MTVLVSVLIVTTALSILLAAVLAIRVVQHFVDSTDERRRFAVSSRTSFDLTCARCGRPLQ